MIEVLRGWSRSAAALPALFFGALLVASVCHPDGAALAVHAQLCAALFAFLLVGTALDEMLGLSGPFIFHRICIGQLALLSWFYLRSLPSQLGLPGIGRTEIWLVVFATIACAVWWKRRSTARGATGIDPALSQPTAVNAWQERAPLLTVALVLLAWSAALHWFLGRYSGHLETPSSDTDLHAFFAKLTVGAGQIVRTQAPHSLERLTYPSGFAALNAIATLLGNASPAAIVTAQPALQSCIAVGLVLEAGIALRGKLRASWAILLLGVAFLLLVIPVHPDAPFLEGTARLAGAPLLLLPLTYTLRLRVGEIPERTRRGLLLLVISSALIFSFALNPALLLATPPLLLCALLLSRDALRAPWPAWIGALLLAALVVGSDAWVHVQIADWRNAYRGATSSALANPSAPQPAGRSPARALLRGVRAAVADSALGIFPRGCVASAQCRDDLAPLRDWSALAFALALVVLALRRRWPNLDGASSAAWLLFSLGAALWLARVISGAASTQGGSGAAVMETLLPRYAREGIANSALLLWLLALDAVLALAARLAEPFVAARGGRLGADLIVVGAALALFATLQMAEPSIAEETLQASSSALGEPLPSSLGAVEPIDLEFVHAAGQIVPHGERLLLPGLPTFSGLEAWIYPVGTSRAVPLDSSIDFAFFLGMGSGEFSAATYRRHVCRALDLPWLAARGVNWLVISPLLLRGACVHEFDSAAARYFTPVLRIGDRVLLQLRHDLLAEAAQDPLLGIAQSEPLHGERGGGPIGELLQRGPIAVRGWACDAGNHAPVSVELELTGARGEIFHELHAASLESREGESRCTGLAHGFAFAPVVAPAGNYRARMFAWDGAGKERVLLAEDFSIQLEF